MVGIVPAFAQQAQPRGPAPGFQVAGYSVEGRVLLKSEDFTRVVSPFVGRGKTAADLERARGALQDTYHNLGHCTVRVSLAQSEPQDGMVTFRVTEVPAAEVRDCLPMVALDAPARTAPAAGARETPTVYSYADPREPGGPALKPRAAAAPTPPAAAPRNEPLAQVAPAPASAAPGSKSDPAPGGAPTMVRIAALPTEPAGSGVTVAPYREGVGGKGLALMSDSRDSPASLAIAARVPEPELKRPDTASPTLSTASATQSAPVVTAPATEARPRAAAVETGRTAPVKPPSAPAQPRAAPESAFLAVVEPIQPGPLKPGPAASPGDTRPAPDRAFLAVVEPAQPAPVRSAPAVVPAATSPAAAGAFLAVVEPAQPAPARPPQAIATADTKPGAISVPGDQPAKPASAPKPVATAAAAPLAGDMKNATDARPPFVGTAAPVPTSQPAASAPAQSESIAAARADPVKPVPPAAAETRTPPAAQAAVVAQAEPAKPAPAKPAAAAPELLEPQAGPRFDITRYLVEGNTLLKPERIERILARFTGPAKDFGDVQRALEALQVAYQNEGYGGVEIRLPEQELDKGEVKLRVIEPRIGRVTVEGNEFFNEANIRRSVPALREGQTPNSRDIGRNVRLANDNPAKQTAVLLRASDQEDQLDATVRVSDVSPKRFSVSLDNTGNEETQRERLGLAFQHANLFNRDHILTLQFITAPQNFNDVLVFGLGYRIPLYSLGDSIDFVAGYSNVDSGTVQDLFVVAGKGSVFALRYNQNLPRWGDLEHRISYGLDYRSYQNDVTPVGGNFKLVPDITVHPLSATYSGAWRAEGKGEVSYYLSLIQNIPGGHDGQDEDFKQVGARFPEGSAGYRMIRTGASYARPIWADWQIRVRADGQYTEDALVSSEMFAIGGADSVRGFNERYASNDKGYRTSWEVYTPDMSKLAGFEGRLRALAFYDQGVVRRNKIQPSELSQASLDSGGVGLRLNYKTALTLRLDVAYVFHDGTSANGKDGQTKAHFSMAWVW